MEWGKVLLLLLALGTTWGSPWCGAQQTKTKSIKSRTFTLPSNCPTSCGNISIQYPFGIGHGCYLPGFNLTCFERYVPPRLFMGELEVTSIDLPSGYVYFQLSVISMGVNQSSITAALIDLQNYHNFNFWATENILIVDGCNVTASLVDLTNNNTIIDYCSTICLDVSPDLSPYVTRSNYCSVYIPEGLPDRVFLGVRLTRLDLQTQLHLDNATAVSAYMISWMGRRSNSTVVSWYIDDHSSCAEAMNDMGTYACISSNSECLDALPGDRGDGTVGYYCRCSAEYEGNPYVTDGCKDVTPANIYPASNCTRKCGSVDIPFPFGLDDESDCYRASSFALSCNRTTTPSVLQYRDKNVSKVDVESGELYLTEVRNSSEDLTLTQGSYVYSWLIPSHSCENARMNKSLFACVSEHVTCRNINGSKGHQLGYDPDCNQLGALGALYYNCRPGYGYKGIPYINGSKGDQLGYLCGCEKGYTGNPYTVNGCQGIYLKTLPS